MCVGGPVKILGEGLTCFALASGLALFGGVSVSCRGMQAYDVKVRGCGLV